MLEETDFEIIPHEYGPNIFQQPVCLIESGADGSLSANPEALRQLVKIDKWLNIVAIAGLYKTGRSYLMNRLAGTSKGFALGSCLQPETKGIWVWCTPHPIHKDQVLVLLDTEGLGDVAKGDPAHDVWIFALATLLSSTLVYNVLCLNPSAFDFLNMATNILEDFQSNKDESKTYMWYLPTLVVTLRDFRLELKVGGREITPDEYLDHILNFEREPPRKRKKRKLNTPRKCLTEYFNSTKCFTFEQPGKAGQLKDLENVTDADLNQEFVNSSKKFCSHIYENCERKELDTGMAVTGKTFVTMVETFLESIRDGGMPSIERTLSAIAVLENSKTIEESVKLYCTLMTVNAQLPTKNHAVLAEVHDQALQDVVEYFSQKAVYDDRVYHEQLIQRIEEKYAQVKKRNEEESERVCRDLLNNLNEVINKKLSDGAYLCNGGYALYQNDLHTLQSQYSSTPGLGVKAKDVLQAFWIEKSLESEALFAECQKKRTEGERQMRMESAQEMFFTHQGAEGTERIVKEAIARLEKKHADELSKLTNHLEQLIESRFEDQSRARGEHWKEIAENPKSAKQIFKEAVGQKKGTSLTDTPWTQNSTEAGQVNQVIIADTVITTLRTPDEKSVKCPPK